MNESPDRLYVAVRADLPPGLQMAQAFHAGMQFSHDHPHLASSWLIRSNFLVIVSVPDEDALIDACLEANAAGLTMSLVREPDLDAQATAAAFEPGELARCMFGSHPLALRDVKNPPKVSRSDTYRGAVTPELVMT